MYKVSERIAEQVEKLIGDPVYQKKYFNTGIAIQNNAWMEDYAKRKLDETCECLLLSGFCNRACDRCVLERAHKKALEEIKAGLRSPKRKVKRGDVIVRKTFVNGQLKKTETMYF